jgi:hypothetical protein
LKCDRWVFLFTRQKAGKAIAQRWIWIVGC